MKVKLIKKSVSLLLVLCMLLSFVPMGVFAAAPDTSDDDFYKIVHLDAARKYFSKDVIIGLIDDIAEMGYNQLELYLGDNQGFRFMLDNKTITTASGITYNLETDGIVNSGYVGDDPWFAGYFRPSKEAELGMQYYLTQTDMDAIIAHANTKGIEIVPAINMPGHMGAILMNRPDDWHYYHNGTKSQSSLNLDNQAAVEYAQAILEAYVTYFAGKGCKFFSIGSDEYGYDAGMKVGDVTGNAALHSKLVTFMNQCAKIITDHNMVPRAFNEFFTATSGQSEDFQIYFWSGSNLTALEGKYDIINTSDTCYYVVDGQWYSEAECAKGTAAFNPKQFTDRNGNSATIADPAGAMMCIWCDRGYYDDDSSSQADGGASVVNRSAQYLRTFASKLPQSKTINLTVGAESVETLTIAGQLTADQIKEQLKLNGIADVIIVNTTGSAGGGLEAVSTISGGEEIVIGNGTYYLTYNGTSLGRTNVAANAAKWTVISNSGNFLLQSGSNYLQTGYSGEGLITPTSQWNGRNWEYTNDGLKGSQANVYIDLSSDTPSISASATGVKAYTVAASTLATTFKLKGVNAGSTTFTLNGVEYTVNVAGEHTHVYDQPATCQKKVHCVCGEEVSEGALDPNNHVGTLSTANCATPATYSVCGHTVGGTNPAVHTGETYVDGYRAPSETVAGYTGDTRCSGCNVKLADGESIPVVHTHTGGVATCKVQAACSICGEPYGNLDPSYHAGDYKVIGIDKYYIGSLACADCGTWIMDREGSTGYNEATMIYVEVPANGTASHTVEGALGSNGASGNTDNGLASYTVAINETPSGGSSYPDWVSGTAYNVGDIVVYNGVVYQCTFAHTADAASGWVPGGAGMHAIWTARTDLSATSGGTGEPVTQTTVTFTGGPTNGNDTVTIGNKVFFITVKGGNDPIIPGVTCDHEWQQRYDANAHWEYCAKCEMVRGRQNHAGGNATCEHKAVCSTCKQAYGELAEHRYSVATCETLATCSVCGGTTGELAPHAGGTATCKDKAVCDICKKPYGELNPDVHAGPMIEIEGTYIPPTETSDGKAANMRCSHCNVIVEGAVLPKLHTEDITLYIGGTQIFTLPNITLPEQVLNDGFVKIEVVNIPAKQAVGPNKLTDYVAVIGAEQIIVGNGTDYIKVENGTLTTTTNINEAAQWTVERHDSGFELSYMVDGTKYYFTGTNDPNNLVRFVPESDANLGTHPGWKVGDNNLLTEFFYSNGQMVIGNGTISTVGGATGASGTGNAYAYFYTPATPASTEIRIEALETTTTPSILTVGSTTYSVTVLPDSTEGKQIEVEFFQTNAQVTAANGATKYVITADMGGWNADTGEYDTVHSKLGIAIDEVGQEYINGEYVKDDDTFPYYGTSSRGQEVAYGNGMVLDSQHHQDPWANNNVPDRSGDGIVFYYVRYWGGQWAVSDADREVWYPVEDGSQYVAYYLQHTEVTNRNIVSTYVMDWGDMKDVFASGDKTQWSVLDFAIKFEGGIRDPELNEFIQPTKSAFYHNIPTWSVVGGEDLVQAEYAADGTAVNKRRVRDIEGLETGDYEIYMITLTRTSDTITERLPYNTPADVTNYSYNGTEYVVWLEDEDTVFDASSVVAPGENNPYEITYGTDTWGTPSIEEVWIYEHQGVLLTYYVRAIHREENLHVFYRVDNDVTYADDPIVGEAIYDYEIPTDEQYFSHSFAADASSDTGLTGNTVVNVGGTTEVVTSVLTDMPAVPPQYRVGGYEFTGKILYGYEDADGNMVYVEKSQLPADADLKHVVMYYQVDAAHHYVPVDFGVPLEIHEDLFHFESLIDSATEAYVVESITLQRNQDSLNRSLKYGRVDYVNVEGSLAFSLRYTPNNVMQGPEDPVNFVINVTIKDKATGEVKTNTDVIHGVVFLPATTVYYEESFSTPVTEGNWNTTKPIMANEDPQDTQCYFRQNFNYGFDPYYQNEMGNSHDSFTQTSVNGEYRSFEFTGTGIEIYANCTNNTGIALITILNAETDALVKTYIVDTRMVKGDSPATADQLDLFAYNVPIVSELGLEHGRYTVKVASIKAGDPDRRNQAIMFDGFRVYNTLENNDPVHETNAGAIYMANKEKAPYYAQVRDAVLNSLTIDPSALKSVYANEIAKNAMAQVYDVYGTDESIYGLIISPSYAYSSSTQITDPLKLDLLDNGPKNEVYLWGGDSVTFSYNASEYDIQVGLKALNNYGIAGRDYTIKLDASVMSGANSVGKITVPVDANDNFATSTDMYYPVELNDGTTGNVTVTIKNSAPGNNNGPSLGVISVTRVKFIPKDQNTNANARIEYLNSDNSSSTLFQPLTEDSLTAAFISLGYAETPVEDIPGDDVPEVTTPDVEFVGASLSLKGDIGLNFYVKLSDAILADEDAYMQFIVGGNTKKVPLTDGILDESDGSYRFSVALNAKNMGDAVVAQVFNEDGAVGDSKTLSIKDYADYVIKNSNKGQLVKLMKAMLNYGAAAQIEFNYNIDNLVNADLDDADKTKPGKADVDAFEHTISGKEEGITVTSASLLLQSETKIRIYFKLADGKTIDDYTFSVDGETFVPVLAEGGEYYIEKANVAAKDLDSVYEFQMGGLTLTYSGMSYINQVQKRGGEDVDLMNLAKTLYEYCQAANVYFG